MITEQERIREKARDYLKGLIGIPLIFDGNVLCPECFHFAMGICGAIYFCKVCGGRFPGTIMVDKWGQRWLNLHN